MNYRSHRVASRRWNRLEIAVTGPSVPLSVSRILLDVTIAGRKYHYVYPRAANLTQVVEWDGLDIYGRSLKGKQPYAYSISYGYPVDYAPPPRLPRAGLTGNLDDAPRTFGMPSGLSFPDLVPARAVHDLSDTYTGYLGSIDVDDIAPGWTLENHHVYDPTDGVLHMGDGRDVGARSGLGAIYTIAGSGSRVPEDGQSAKASRLEFINGMDIGPDGSLHVACRQDSVIWRIGRDGVLRKMAHGRPWFDVNVAPDGSLYLTDGEGSRIWKRGPDGTLSVVAGTGISSFEGDGGPATAARLHTPNNAVLGPDGSLYIADRGNHRVRKVTPDGIIQTVAGTGVTAFNGDGIPAREANMSVTHLAVAADGSLYVADGVNCRIRRIDAGGIVTTVAGNGALGSLGDGGPALEAQITADRIKVANTKAGGTVIYLSDDLNNTIRVIDENGIIHRLAGGGVIELKDGLPGTEANLSEPRGLAVDANGTVYIGRFTSGQTAVRKIQSRFPGYDNKTLLIPSPGGGEVFQFSAEGRHLKTFHAFTGAELLAFAYDAAGRLTHITDAHKNVTEIRRGPSGAASALISPYGQT
ncbi:MAG TPA: hypothetical protein VK465_08835, partial [Fibrobacteria bacterium]|nr:hypothetical protein [Fibrobacteria bacterium]